MQTAWRNALQMRLWVFRSSRSLSQGCLQGKSACHCQAGYPEKNAAICISKLGLVRPIPRHMLHATRTRHTASISSSSILSPAYTALHSGWSYSRGKRQIPSRTICDSDTCGHATQVFSLLGSWWINGEVDLAALENAAFRVHIGCLGSYWSLELTPEWCLDWHLEWCLDWYLGSMDRFTSDAVSSRGSHSCVHAAHTWHWLVQCNPPHHMTPGGHMIFCQEDAVDFSIIYTYLAYKTIELRSLQLVTAMAMALQYC